MRLQRHIQEGSIYINKAYLKEIIKLITNFRDRLVYNINNEPELYQTYDEEALFHELNDFVIKNFSKLKYGFALRIAKQTGTSDAYTLIRFKNGKPFGEIVLLLDMRRLLDSFLKDAKFKAWIKRISATLSHEMIHVAQFRQIADLKTPREFDDLLSTKQKAFVSWSDSERTEVVSNIDKYLADKQEVMAFARGAAQELWNIKDWKVRKKGTPEIFTGEARREMVLDMVRGKGLSKLALFSQSFRNYYNRRKKFPKTWKKFLRHFVDYVTVVEGDVSELFKSDIPIDVRPTRRKKTKEGKRVKMKNFSTSWTIDKVTYYFEANWEKTSFPRFQKYIAAKHIPDHEGYFDITFGVRFAPEELKDKIEGSFDLTGLGHAPRVLSAVIKSFKQFMKDRNPNVFQFTSMNEKSRVKIYDRFANWIEKTYKYEVIRKPRPDEIEWIFWRGEKE